MIGKVPKASATVKEDTKNDHFFYHFNRISLFTLAQSLESTHLYLADALQRKMTLILNTIQKLSFIYLHAVHTFTESMFRKRVSVQPSG